MKKLLIALMLCFVSIAGLANFSAMYVFGGLQSTGECIPKSYNWEEFREVEWTLLADHEKIVIQTGDDTPLVFMIIREIDDTTNGIRTIYARDALSGTDVKMYYYLNEAATKEFIEKGGEKPVYELDIDDYMNRSIFSLLFLGN